MNKESLKKHIDLYRLTEKNIQNLYQEHGICVWDSPKPNFYNNYNWIIHCLLLEIFNEEKVDLLEHYIFNQIDISFDELCNKLEIKD